MNTIYFIGKNGGVKLRPTSQANRDMWVKWYESHGLKLATREEYNQAKLKFNTAQDVPPSDDEGDILWLEKLL